MTTLHFIKSYFMCICCPCSIPVVQNMSLQINKMISAFHKIKVKNLHAELCFFKFPQSPGCFTANSQDFIILFYFRAYAAYEDSIEECPATEHEERKLLVEYLEKLKLYENNSVVQKMLPHPLEI